MEGPRAGGLPKNRGDIRACRYAGGAVDDQYLSIFIVLHARRRYLLPAHRARCAARRRHINICRPA